MIVYYVEVEIGVDGCQVSNDCSSKKLNVFYCYIFVSVQLVWKMKFSVFLLLYLGR